MPIWSLICLLTLFFTGAAHAHDHSHSSHAHPAGSHTEAQAKGPVKMTMEELHQHGGAPPGWTFTLPSGNPATGRQVFIDTTAQLIDLVAYLKSLRDKPEQTGTTMHHHGSHQRKGHTLPGMPKRR